MEQAISWKDYVFSSRWGLNHPLTRQLYLPHYKAWIQQTDDIRCHYFVLSSCTEVQSVVEAIFSRHNFVCHQLNAINSNNLKCYLAARIKSSFFVFLMSPTSILSPLWFLLPVSCIKMASETLKSKKSKTEQPKPLWFLGCHLSFVVLFCFFLSWFGILSFSLSRKQKC